MDLEKVFLDFFVRKIVGREQHLDCLHEWNSDSVLLVAVLHDLAQFGYEILLLLDSSSLVLLHSREIFEKTVLACFHG